MNDYTLRGFFDQKCEVISWENNQKYTREAFIDRSLSSSYTPRKGDETYETFIRDLHALFDEFANGNTLIYPLTTVVYYGKLEHLRSRLSDQCTD